ncbi:MAG: DUF1801 domain-containing protein [Chloroflexia bacterium]
MSSTDVTAYIDALTVDWQADIARTLHARIHEAIPDVAERLQYSKPHYLKNKKYACVIAPAKGWVALTIFNATTIDAPQNLFEPGPPSAKPSKSSPTQPIDYDLLTNLIRQAAATI